MKLQVISLFLIVVKTRCLHGANQSSLSRTTLITLLQKLCLGADVCRENQTTFIPKETFNPGYESCCKDCSCAPDCTEYGTCCFPDEMATKQSVDASTAHVLSGCLLASTSLENAGDRLLQYFNMITSVQQSRTDQSSTNKSCGDTKIAPWGSLYPVYSPKRKRIYKNNVCALADNVDDGKIWDAVLVCNKNLYDLGNLSDYCRVDFIYTGESKDLQPLQCFDYITKTCSKSTYRIPRDIEEYSYEAIDEACTSGLVSPFRYITLEQFANVFCYICNGGIFPDEIHLRNNQIINIEERHSQIAGNIVGLIDPNFLDNFDQTITHNFPQACTDHKNNKRRNIFCPHGKLRDYTGKCRRINTIWYNQFLVVALNLTADSLIDAQEMFLDENGLMKTTLPDFESPWKRPWEIILIRCFREHFELGKTRTLSILLAAEFKEFNPSLLFKSLEHGIGGKLFMNSFGQSYSFNITFWKDASFKRKGTFIPLGNSTKIIDRAAYKLLYHKIKTIRPTQQISKLYLCNQVELHQSEFVLSDDKTVLFNEFTKNILYSGEFALMEGANESVTARVCIEDSGLHIANHFEKCQGNSVRVYKYGLVLTMIMIAWHTFYR